MELDISGEMKNMDEKLMRTTSFKGRLTIESIKAYFSFGDHTILKLDDIHFAGVYFKGTDD